MAAELTDSYQASSRTRLRRRPGRAHYDRPTVHAILDSGALCQIGYVDDGQPLVLATIYWRNGETLYWHGSRQSRALQAMAGAQVCFSVSHLDGLVLARSAFRHSANYRAVMAFGEARRVEEDVEKLAALKAMIERLYPGRWAQIRPPSDAELASSTVLSLELEEVSAKIRDEPALDVEGDLALPVWAGVAPLKLMPGALEPCDKLDPAKGEPRAIIDWSAVGVSAR